MEVNHDFYIGIEYHKLNYLHSGLLNKLHKVFLMKFTCGLQLGEDHMISPLFLVALGIVQTFSFSIGCGS